MSSSAQLGAQPRTRPTVVTVAVWLLYLAAALQLISLVVDLSQLSTIADTYEDAYRGTGDEDAMRTGAIFSTSAGAVIGGLFGIAFILLGIFTGRGKNPARITTWVIAGLGVCCGTLGVIANAVSGSLNLGSSDTGPSPEELRERLDAALPSWYNPVVLTLAVLVLLSLLTVIILLALPPSNEFFRKPEAVWQPPTYPQAGGYPQPGDYPAPGSSYPPPAAPPAPGIPPPSANPSPSSGGESQPGGSASGGSASGGESPAGPPPPGGPPA